MPDFDYKSFMAGLQVGRRIRLWDASANKPPMPPTPSGRYVLMEDGTPIVAEQPDWGEVSVIDSDVWYDLKTPFTVDGVDYEQVRFRMDYLDFDDLTVHEFLPSCLFYYSDSEADYLGQAVFTSARLAVDELRLLRFVIDYVTSDGVKLESTWAWALPLGPTENGIVYYDLQGVWNIPAERESAFNRMIMPVEIVDVLPYTSSSDIGAYLSGLSENLLITE